MKYSQCYSKIDLVLKLSEQQQKSVFPMKELEKSIYFNKERKKGEKFHFNVSIYVHICVCVSILELEFICLYFSFNVCVCVVVQVLPFSLSSHLDSGIRVFTVQILSEVSGSNCDVKFQGLKD